MNESAPDFAVQACVATDVGCVRETNEDAVAFVCPADAELRRRRGVLAVVADGMGGHLGGEVASVLAVETICRCYFAAPADQEPLRAVELAVLEANRAIYRQGDADPALIGMGTTATVLVLLPTSALYAHVGDSRLYRCAKGRCIQLTQDHTLVEQLLQDGMISALEARYHPMRNILLRSLGTRRGLRVAVQRCAAPAIGETFVLCSDGLHGSVEPADIAEAVGTLDPEQACRRLIDLARERDGSDNISVGVIAVRASSGLAAQ
ncbi:PP2C family serine/threonine-protein phosphatase [Accumulibacter sp.]|uniref:protein phosphatase 2C domain-containing protein n=1 Tax=Accumulibacter sp. TaxID=2053492 RepID=UPI00260596BD|nr:PP2C family serine/threonine-protein phosphatase [Accumulibacter sp.]